MRHRSPRRRLETLVERRIGIADSDEGLAPTSPVVAWNESTIRAAKMVTLAVSWAKKDDARFAERLEALQVEMEAAWESK